MVFGREIVAGEDGLTSLQPASDEKAAVFIAGELKRKSQEDNDASIEVPEKKGKQEEEEEAGDCYIKQTRKVRDAHMNELHFLNDFYANTIAQLRVKIEDLQNKLQQKDQGPFQRLEKPDKPKRTTKQAGIKSGGGGGGNGGRIGRPRKCKECGQNLPAVSATGSGKVIKPMPSTPESESTVENLPIIGNLGRLRKSSFTGYYVGDIM